MTIFEKPLCNDDRPHNLQVIGHADGKALVENMKTAERFFVLLDENQAPVGTFLETDQQGLGRWQ